MHVLLLKVNNSYISPSKVIQGHH